MSKLAYLDQPVRSFEQAKHDIALRKAETLQPMTKDELALLTEPELGEMAKRAEQIYQREEAAANCYISGKGDWCQELRRLASGAWIELDRRKGNRP